MSDLKAGRSHKKDRDSISGSPNAAALRKIITTDVDVLQFKSFPVNVYKMFFLLIEDYSIIKAPVFTKKYILAISARTIIPVDSFLFNMVLISKSLELRDYYLRLAVVHATHWQ